MDAKVFLSAAPPHLADLDDRDAAALKRQAADLGFAVFELDGARMQTKAELMDHLAAALSFPHDFGRNWEFNFGVGVGMTQATDHLLVKAIVGYRLHNKKD